MITSVLCLHKSSMIRQCSAGSLCQVLMSMEVLHDTTGKKEAVVCYMDTQLPYAIEENFGGCFFEDDVDLAQVLQDQVLCRSLFASYLAVSIVS